jgi:very-short-patch-repair endonuclease
MTDTKSRYGSTLEEYFAYLLTEAKIPFEAQYKAVPGRRYSWDFYIPEAHLLVEIQGGTWTHSGHTTHDGLHRDYTKNNLAVMNGWPVMYFDAEMVHNGEALTTVTDYLFNARAAHDMRDMMEIQADMQEEDE